MQKSAKLLALGDISLHGFSQTQFKQSAAYIALVQRLNGFDGVTLANLECPLTKSKNFNLNKYALHADPGLFSELPRIDLFSLSNNHIFDALEQGVNDTIQLLDEHKTNYFGYGQDLLEARQPALIERNGIRLGFLGYSCLSTNGQDYATPERPGVCPLAIEHLQTDILRLKEKADHIIVVLHWGEEHVHYPTPDQIAVAHHAIDFGASVIIGTHAHAIQGIERYKDGFICYSLGNFIFSNAESEELFEGKRVRRVVRLSRVNKESIGVEFAFEKDKVSLTSVRAFKLDKWFLPNEVHMNSLHTNLSKLNARLVQYIEEKSDYLRKIKGPQIIIKFSHGKCGNYYLLKPIYWSQTSVRWRALKFLLANTLRRVTRLFLGLRGN